MKHYITISEFNDVHCFHGEISQDLLAACDDGIYDAIDITDPEKPLRYCGGKWEDCEVLEPW